MAFEGQGLDARNVDRLDILARSVRANAEVWLARYRVNDHVYCLKRYGDGVPLKVLRDMARVAPKGAVMCGMKDCGHGCQ